MIEHTIWLAEGTCGGEVQFDAEPRSSDVWNACADLEAPITVYVVTTREIDREVCYSLGGPPKGWGE